MAIITMENRAQTAKPPRVERRTLPAGSEIVTIQWGAAQITLDPDEARKLADAITGAVDN